MKTNKKINLVLTLLISIITISINNNISCMDNFFPFAQRTTISDKEQSLNQKLFKACADGDLKTVRYLIEKEGIKFNIQKKDTKQLIKTIYKNNSLEIFKYLIEKKHITFNNPNSPCIKEAKDIYKYNSFKIFKYLVEKKHIKPYMLGLFGYNPIDKACQYNAFDIVKYLIEENWVKPNTQTWGQGLIHIACKYNSFDIVKYLIEKQKIKPNTPNEDGDTPIILCCDDNRNNNVPPGKTFKYLIEKCGISPNTVNKDGKPLIILCMDADLNPDFNKVKYLIEEKNIDPKNPKLDLFKTSIKEYKKMKSYDSLKIIFYLLKDFIKDKDFDVNSIDEIFDFNQCFFYNYENLKLILEQLQKQNIPFNCFRNEHLGENLIESFIDNPRCITSVLNTNSINYKETPEILKILYNDKSFEIKRKNNAPYSFFIDAINTCLFKLEDNIYIRTNEEIYKCKDFINNTINICIVFRLLCGINKIDNAYFKEYFNMANKNNEYKKPNVKKRKISNIKKLSRNLPPDCAAVIMSFSGYYCKYKLNNNAYIENTYIEKLKNKELWKKCYPDN